MQFLARVQKQLPLQCLASFHFDLIPKYPHKIRTNLSSPSLRETFIFKPTDGLPAIAGFI
jgi:hypothetical protein